jgi:hypothetical protein
LHDADGVFFAVACSESEFAAAAATETGDADLEAGAA